MKLFLILFLLSLGAHANEKCSLLELKGHVETSKSGITLVIAKSTLSERRIPVHIKAETPFLPYNEHFVSGTFVVSDKVLEVKNIDNAVPDPLNQNEKTTLKKLKDVPCPKL